MAKKTNQNNRAVVVCTDKRGVFFGYTDAPVGADPIIMTEVRMCQYWSAATKGVLGLASTGPMGGSRVGPPIPKAELRGVTAVLDCSSEAEKRWLAGIWS
jgi:hypothetical protein